MGAPGTRAGSSIGGDPGTIFSTQQAAIAQMLTRVVTIDQLNEAVEAAVGDVTTDGLAQDDLSNVLPNVGRAALGLGSSATRSVAQLATEGVFTTTFVQPAGDLSGDAVAPVVARIRGVAVSGTPSTGQVLKATSSTAATWADAPSGGGSGSTVIDGGGPDSTYGGTMPIDGGTP